MNAYIEARKQPDGKWELFYRGTRNHVEGFETTRFDSMHEAHNAMDIRNMAEKFVNPRYVIRRFK